MPHSEYRLLAIVLMLTSGCTTPFFAGQSSHGRQNDETSPLASTPAEPVSVSPMRRSPATDRKPAPDETAAQDAAAATRRIPELLSAAARARQAGNLDRARVAYEEVLQLDPRNMTAHFQLAVIADDQRRFTDAEQHYFALLQQSPQNPDILASLGWSYLLQERYDDCERTLRESLRYAPNHQLTRYNLGWLYGNRGDYDQALAIFRSAGTESEAQRALAEVKAAARDKPSARTISAPTPWNDNRAEIAGYRQDGQVLPAAGTLANPAREDHRYPGDRFASPTAANLRPGKPPSGDNREDVMQKSAAIDASAASWPAQANLARQASLQNTGVTSEAVNPDSAVSRAGRTQPAGFEHQAPAGMGPPVIMPAAADARIIAARSGNDARNAAATSPPRAAEPNHQPTPPSGQLPEWPRNPPAAMPGLAGPVPLPGESRGAPPASDVHSGPASWSDARRAAARMGLNAGPGGTLFPIEAWENAAPATPTESAAGSLSGTAAQASPPAPLGTWPPKSDDESHSRAASVLGQVPGAQREPGAPPPRQGDGSRVWPGRRLLPAPTPTEIIPTDHRTSTPGAGATGVSETFYGRSSP